MKISPKYLPKRLVGVTYLRSCILPRERPLFMGEPLGLDNKEREKGNWKGQKLKNLLNKFTEVFLRA